MKKVITIEFTNQPTPLSSEKWRKDPSMEVAASNWIDFCIKGNYYYSGYCEDS